MSAPNAQESVVLFAGAQGAARGKTGKNPGRAARVFASCAPLAAPPVLVAI
jgi:hypothetical protein